MRVLLAIDGSRESRSAALVVAAQQWPRKSQIRVVTVVHNVYSDDRFWGYGEEGAESFDRLVREVDKTTLRLTAFVLNMLREKGMSLEMAIRRGEPGLELLEDARRWRADVVVLGSHGRGGNVSRLFGSVAEYVLLNASCSVDVVATDLPPAARRHSGAVRASVISRARGCAIC